MNRSQVVICANHGGFGGAHNLNQALNKHSSRYRSSLVVAAEAPYGFGNGLFPSKDFAKVDELFQLTENLFICDYQGLSAIAQYLSIKMNRRITHGFRDTEGIGILLDWLRKKKVIFFWSGTRFMMNSRTVNSWVSTLSCKRTFAMPELRRFDPRACPLYQPFDLPVSQLKYDNFTACHSPGHKNKYRKGQYGKGTEKIERALKRLERKHQISYIIITGLPYAEALDIKSRSHVFVDQIMPKIGGIGKSGLEAITMGVPTLGDIRACEMGEHYAGLPVIPIRNGRELFFQLCRLCEDKEYLDGERKRCLEWRHKLSYAATAAYLDRMMIW